MMMIGNIWLTAQRDMFVLIWFFLNLYVLFILIIRCSIIPKLIALVFKLYPSSKIFTNIWWSYFILTLFDFPVSLNNSRFITINLFLMHVPMILWIILLHRDNLQILKFRSTWCQWETRAYRRDARHHLQPAFTWTGSWGSASRFLHSSQSRGLE